MKIAWNEIKYQPKKFILIEVLIVIMMFMVIFLSGLTNGLGRIIMAQIDTFGDVQYILSKDSEGVIPYSTRRADGASNSTFYIYERGRGRFARCDVLCDGYVQEFNH